MQVGLQRDTGLGWPGDFSSIKNPHSSLFSNKTEAIHFRVLQFKCEFRQHFRHLHFWASWDLGATVQTRAGNTVQAALNLFLFLQKSNTGKH